MLRFLAVLIAATGLGLLLVLAEKVRRPPARLARALLVGLVAILTVAGLAIGVTGIANEAWWAAIIGGGILAVGLRLGWALRRRRHPSRADFPEHVPLVQSAPASFWRRFEAGLDWVARKQARRARTAIDSFVAERNSPSLTQEHHGLLLSCEKRVPELIDTCLERCRNASPQECEHYIDSTLDTLTQIGNEAERARREVREADDRRLEVLHRYFDDVAGDEKQRPRLP